MLESIKELLGYSESDTTRDKLLELILALTTKRLKVLLGGIEPPEELGYIVTEVSVARFNRIGSEGATSHSLEGESWTFSDEDFDKYAKDIQMWLNSKKENRIGKVRFL